MPFGHNCEFPDFNSCVMKLMEDGKSKEEAQSICGALKRDTEDLCAAKDSDVEMLESGPLVDALTKAVVESTDDEEVVIDQAFISDDGKLISAQDVQMMAIKHSMRCFNTERIHKETDNLGLLDVVKTHAEGSTQDDREVGERFEGLANAKVVEPPYPPELMSTFLEVDEIHFRCSRTKVMDSVGRRFSLQPTTTIKGEPFDPAKQTDAEKARAEKEITEIKNFMEDCNSMLQFSGVLECAAMDYESVGWAAIEVIRSRDMKIRKIAHIPATRVRVLRGFQGFVEITGPEKFVYYQNFGEKVVSKTRDPLTGKKELYNPREHGELDPNKLEWNLLDRDTGKPTSNVSKAANEIVWIPKSHPNTIYYGFTDVFSALRDVLANIHIKDYGLQFFEHNTVPRYAVIIKGAKLADSVKELILNYFSAHVKGKAHKTLLVPIPSARGDVEVKFEKLDADEKEGSFRETRKNNSQGVMTAHGVSPAIIGIADTANLGSGKGLSQAEIYKDRIIQPFQGKWARKINRLFKLGLGVVMVTLQFDPLDIRDKEAEKDIINGYIERGVLNINEARQRLGLDPVEGGNRNIVITRTGIIFVDELATLSAQDLEGEQDNLEMMIQERQQRTAQDNKVDTDSKENQNGKKETTRQAR